MKWGKLFGGSSGKASKQPEVQASSGSSAKVQGAKDKLDEAEELLQKKQEMLERQIAQQLEKARQFSRQNNKTAALAALKKKKLYEAQLEQIGNNMLRINEQQLMLENSQTAILTVATLGEAAKAAQAVSKELNIDRVDRLRDELDAQHDEMRQIGELLGQPIGAMADLDLDDVEAELEDLEQVVAAEELAAATPAPARIAALHGMPAKQQSKSQEELELQQLEEEMACLAA